MTYIRLSSERTVNRIGPSLNVPSRVYVLDRREVCCFEFHLDALRHVGPWRIDHRFPCAFCVRSGTSSRWHMGKLVYRRLTQAH